MEKFVNLLKINFLSMSEEIEFGIIKTNRSSNLCNIIIFISISILSLYFSVFLSLLLFLFFLFIFYLNFLLYILSLL